ncbi:hypothetical protein C8R44DRAFT_893573 [Mycena epipterygia]|nr:hypothetical protein C8R44DRAFT_893573 [Mycena epipterygia]
MTSRSSVYQSRLEGYFLLRAKPLLTTSKSSPFLPFEGQHWFPIDVDQGSQDCPIDVEWWTYLHENPGDWSVKPNVKVVTVDPKVFECGICWETLSKPVMLIMPVLVSSTPIDALQAALHACVLLRMHFALVESRPEDMPDLPQQDAISDGTIAAPTNIHAVATYDWSEVTFDT